MACAGWVGHAARDHGTPLSLAVKESHFENETFDIDKCQCRMPLNHNPIEFRVPNVQVATLLDSAKYRVDRQSWRCVVATTSCDRRRSAPLGVSQTGKLLEPGGETQQNIYNRVANSSSVRHKRFPPGNQLVTQDC